MSDRILFFSHSAARAGATKSLQLLMQGLRNLNIEVAVVMPQGPVNEDYRIAELHTFIAPSIGYLISTYGSVLKGNRLIVSLIKYFISTLYNNKISAILKKYQPSIVHCNEFGMFNIAKLAKKRGIRVVMHVRTPVSDIPLWYRKWANVQVMQYVDCIVAIDGSVKNSLRGIADNALVVYNPLPAFNIPQPNKLLSSRDDDKVHVTFLSGLLPLKGIWDMIDAAYLLRDRSDIVFDVYGENLRSKTFLSSPWGWLGKKTGVIFDMEKEIRQKIDIMKLNTVIMHGYVSNIYDVMKTTNILLFPSHLNGPGRSVFEAGMYGVPSIVTMKDRIEDIVIDNVTGIIVKEKSPADLASAILRLADDPGLRLRLGVEAQSKYIRQFEITSVCNGMNNIYKALNCSAVSNTKSDEL